MARGANSAHGGAIRVQCINPGPTMTEMHVGITSEVVAMAEKAVPVGRFGTSGEITAGVLFLLSDEASYVYERDAVGRRRCLMD